METKKFATAVLAAMRIREESYDHKAANAVLDEKRNFTNFEKFYKKSYYKATKEAVNNIKLNSEMIQPIYLLIKYNWNEIGDWAQKSFEEKKIIENENPTQTVNKLFYKR